MLTPQEEVRVIPLHVNNFSNIHSKNHFKYYTHKCLHCRFYTFRIQSDTLALILTYAKSECAELSGREQLHKVGCNRVQYQVVDWGLRIETLFVFLFV